MRGGALGRELCVPGRIWRGNGKCFPHIRGKSPCFQAVREQTYMSLRIRVRARLTI